MKNIRLFFLSENFHFLVVKFSAHLNRYVFEMVVFTYAIFYICRSLLRNAFKSIANTILLVNHRNSVITA